MSTSLSNSSQTSIGGFQTSTRTLPALQSFADFQTLASEPPPSLISNLESQTWSKFAPAMLTFPDPNTCHNYQLFKKKKKTPDSPVLASDNLPEH